LARFTYVVLSRAHPGQEEEYVKWYKEHHMVDVLKFPEVVSAKLHRLDFQRVYDLDAPQWTCITIYELEGEDPETIVNKLRDASFTDAMKPTDTLNKNGMIQAVGHIIAEGN